MRWTPRAEQFRDREAYLEGDRRVTFGAWLDDADRVAALLADRGVHAGDVVAILLPTSIDYAITYAAIARLGAIATGLNPRLGAREVAAIFERAEPKLAVLDDGPLPAGLPPDVTVFRRHDLGAARRVQHRPAPHDARVPPPIRW